MPYIPPEVVEQARQIDLLTYLQSCEPQELVRISGNNYTTRTHDSLKISNGKWMWWSQRIGGYNALDYLVKVKGCSFVETVETLMGKAAVMPSTTVKPKQKTEPKVLLLPDKSASTERITEYLFGRGIDYAINPYGTQVRGLFQEGASYIAEYESFDKTTKGYIMCCLGNSRMSMPRSTPEECTEYMKVFDKAMGIITDPYYHQLDPDLPWGKFEYAMHMDRETLLGYLRHYNDPVVAAKVMESAEAIYRDRVLYKGEEARLQNWRVSYLYKAACFHAGRCTAREVVEELLDIIHHTDIQDYSDTGINKNLTAVSYLVAYEVEMPPADRREMAYLTEEVMDRSLRYLNNVPQNRYSRVVSRAVRELVEMQAEAGTARRSLLNYILVAHKPTYVHSMMVAGLTRVFVKQMLKKSPELFVGVMGCKTVEEVRRSRIEICELAYECGLYHDVGKSYVFTYIGNNYRRLLDEEFTCIQWHTVFGYELLCNVGGKDDLAPAALYHHTFYDGHGGYPKNYPPCPAGIKPIVDALTVADSLDAATDNIGRCYTTAKPVDTLLGEFHAQRGTRYAPEVVALLDDEDFCRGLKETLDETRKSVYLEVYHVKR